MCTPSTLIQLHRVPPMPTSMLARVLSASILALAVVGAPACAGEAAKGKDGKNGKDDKAGDAASDKSGEKPAEPIAGKPVEGEGKVATAPGGGAEEKEYALKIDPGEAKVGEESKVSIRVVPQGEWHMNLEYPTKLEITPPAGTTMAKPSLAKADAVKLDEQSCEFAVAFTPQEVGDKKFTGEFKFAICQAEACVPKTETIEFEVAVK